MTPLLLNLAAGVTAVGLGTGTAVLIAPAAPAVGQDAVKARPIADKVKPAAPRTADAIDAAALPADGDIIERLIAPPPRDDSPGRFHIDLDTGHTYGYPAADATDEEMENDASLQGVDLVYDGSTLSPGLRGLSAVVRPVIGDAWEGDAETRQAIADLWRREPAYGDGERMDAIGDLPRTFLFRTRQGSGGVLQIVERTADDELRVRYKILARGEGVSVAQMMALPSRDDLDGVLTPSQRAQEERVRAVMRGVLILFSQRSEDDGAWPADLEAAREAAGDDWPEALPASAVYVPPADDPASPKIGPAPVLFEALRLPPPTKEQPVPFVIVGMDDGSALTVRSAEELAALVKRAGIE